MKIRRNRKIDIDTIIIQKDAYGGTNISIVLNNQMIKLYERVIYIDSVLKKIDEFTKVIGG